jgi:hypothetical protein
MRHRVGWAAVGSTVAAAILLATMTGAVAAGPPVAAGLTVTPTATTVGSPVRVVGTATNTTDAPVAASLGIDNTGNLRVSGLSGSAGCTPRNLTRVVYCGVQHLAPHATATISFTVTPSTSGSYPFRTYARIMYSAENSFAYATLTTS